MSDRLNPSDTGSKALTHKQKVENVAFIVILVSTLPMFVGMGAFELIDHFDVRSLSDQNDPMALVWTLVVFTFVIIGISVCTKVTFLALRRMPGMRESMPAIWEDDEGEPLPQPKEPRPITEEGRRKLRGFRYWITLILIACTGLLSGALLIGISERWGDYMGWTEGEGLEGLGGIIHVAGDIILLMAFLAVLTYILHRFLLSDYGSYIKPFLKGPKDGTEINDQTKESGEDNE